MKTSEIIELRTPYNFLISLFIHSSSFCSIFVLKIFFFYIPYYLLCIFSAFIIRGSILSGGVLEHCYSMLISFPQGFCTFFIEPVIPLLPLLSNYFLSRFLILSHLFSNLASMVSLKYSVNLLFTDSLNPSAMSKIIYFMHVFMLKESAFNNH